MGLDRTFQSGTRRSAVCFSYPIALFAIIRPIVKRDLLPMTVMVVFMLFFGIVGFADDYIKVNISPKGLSVKQKTIWLGMFSIAAAVFIYGFHHLPVYLVIHGKSDPCRRDWESDLCALPRSFPVLYEQFRQHNRRGGRFAVIAHGDCLHRSFAVSGLLAPVIPHVSSTMTLSLIIAGGCLGFLVFNRHPARIFMGDTGSQALGIAFTLLTVVMGVPYLALITGFVFFFEGFSVVLQVIYFKSTGGKRIFRSLPFITTLSWLAGMRKNSISVQPCRHLFLLCWIFADVVSVVREVKMSGAARNYSHSVNLGVAARKRASEDCPRI